MREDREGRGYHAIDNLVRELDVEFLTSNWAPKSSEPAPASPGRAPDSLYATPLDAGRFRFNAEVADVFQDMVERSVPGYASLIHGIAVLGEKYAQTGVTCYDLGCSLGTATRALSARMGPEHPIVAVDSSPDMIARCAHSPDSSVRYLCADIRKMTLEAADVVVLNLTLQFLPPEDRLPLLKRIVKALRPGGALILTEKVRFDDPLEARTQNRYENFKRAQGYSELEISRKRAALERVLVRDSPDIHHERLAAAGFDSTIVWFQCLHFISMLALRQNAKPT